MDKIEVLNKINEIILFKDNIKIRRELLLIMNKLYQEEAFSIGTIIGLKSIILNKYGIPVENKSHTYKNYLEVRNNINFLKECKSKELLSNLEKNMMNYSKSKKNLIDELKRFYTKENHILGTSSNSDVDNYCKFINNEIQTQFLSDSFKIQQTDFKINEITNLDLCFNQTENFFKPFEK